MTSESSWRDERRVAAETQEARLRERQAAESAKAQAVIDAFLVEAQSRRLPVQKLKARSYSGSATYRTGLTGWYIRRDRSVAIGEDGSFYTLAVPSDLAARFSGVTISASEPPLVVGAGGRDGESIALSDLLQIRLAEPDAF